MKQAKAFPEVCEASFDNPSHFAATSIDLELTIHGLASMGGDKFLLTDVPILPIRHLDEKDVATVFGLNTKSPADAIFLDKLLSLHHKHQIMKVLAERMV